MSDRATGEPPEKNQHDVKPAPAEFKYDIAVSFAGEQRQFVEDVVRGLDLPKGGVFYDADYKAALWGEELSEVFTKLYRDEARYVVMFISRDYAEKEWCRVERRSALRRRMRTQGAYILPVRLDSTTLDDVEGLLDTIGDLDGLREGVRGVVECIREKLSAMLTESPGGHETQVGQIAYDAASLTALLQRRPRSWQWAAFGSVLVQRREALRDALWDHKLGYADPTGERISDVQDLITVCRNSMYDVEQLGQQLHDFLLTPSFAAIFGDPKNVSGDPDSVVHIANRVMDFYLRFVQTAQRIRGVSAPAEYRKLLDSCARLSDKPLAGLDDFIDAYEKTVAEMPDLLKAADGKDIDIPLELKIHLDNDLLESIVEQLGEIVERAKQDYESD